MELRDGTWSGGLALTNSRRFIHAGETLSIWFRRPFYYEFPADLQHYERRFVAAEREQALQTLYSSFQCYWMSAPEALRSASWKGEQLARAARMGFAVPETLVTTDPGQVDAFYAKHRGQVIVKSMAGAGAMAGRLGPDPVPAPAVRLATRMLTPDDLRRLDSVKVAPCQFQEYVPKDYEVRATVVGADVFAAEIHSQDDERTRVDFRDFTADVVYKATVLPDDVRERCVEFVRSYGLEYGAVDLIRHPDGRFVFLEVNPTGKFMFVEQRVPELRITDAVADRLAHGGSAHG
ncbi:ATP-grasp domain-containing protein [Catenulispora yoronensis]